MGSIKFHLCDKSDREEIYQLWYKIYFEEMGRNQLYANHELKQISDDIEHNSIIIIAKDENKIVGTSRVHIYPDVIGEIEYYENLYKLSDFSKKNSGKIAIVTRYMVDKDYRKFGLGFSLALATVNFCIKNDIRWIIMDCSPNLYDYFEKIGFSEYLGVLNHKEYGEVKIMKFDVFQNPTKVLNDSKHQSKLEKLILF